MQKLANSSQQTTEEGRIFPKPCPICGVDSNYVYRIRDSEEDGGQLTTWYKCTCGVAFQEDSSNLKESVYDDSYLKAYDKSKKNAEHAARVYLPLIEELTYGRMVLDVGYGTPFIMDHLKDRGWLTWGIDNNSSLDAGGCFYRGDFETYDFSLNIDKEALKDKLGDVNIKRRTFDLIWMSHVFEHFKNPLEALRKAHDLLSPTGVIYISTPDVDFINKTGVGGFPHWKREEHFVLWNESSLRREVKKLGFKVVLSRRNFSSRFISWYDVHLIAQKNYF